MGTVQEVERELTADELYVEWSAVMEKEYLRVREFHQQVLSLQAELECIEERWAAKL